MLPANYEIALEFENFKLAPAWLARHGLETLLRSQELLENRGELEVLELKRSLIVCGKHANEPSVRETVGELVQPSQCLNKLLSKVVFRHMRGHLLHPLHLCLGRLGVVVTDFLLELLLRI